MDNSVKKLILNLSKAEKEYFAKYLKINTISSAINLIDIYYQLENTGNIDLEKLKKEYGEKDFSKKISLGKEKLLETILLSLLDKNLDSGISWRIIKDLLFVKLLLKKNLTEKAEKFIKRAKQNAYRYEEFNLLLNIISIEESMYFNDCFTINYNKLKELNEERKSIIEIIENINYLLTLKAELQEFQFNQNTFSSNLKNFKKIYGHEPFFPEEQVKSKKAKSIWFYNTYACYYIQHDYELALKTTKLRYDFYKQNPEFFSRNEIMQLFSNFLYLSGLTKNKNVFEKKMIEFLSLKNQTKEEHKYIKEVFFSRTLELYYRLSLFNEGNVLAEKAELFIEKNIINTDPFHKRYLHLLIVRAYIDNKNFETALNSLNKHYKTIGYEYNSSIFKLFEFITYYKLSNYNSLICSLDSWTKTIRSKRKQFPIEKVLIRFFRLACNKATVQEKKKLILNTIIQLKEIEKTNLKFYLNHIFDFTKWFERELEEMK